MRHVKTGLILAAVIAVGAGAADAQFHHEKNGQKTTRPTPGTQVTPVNPAAPAADNRYAASTYPAAANATAASIPSNKAASNASNYASVWGYAVHHGDGSYTSSKQDFKHHTLKQETFSKNGTLMLRRLINLDQQGRPTEVMIYNGREEFRYRGVLIYDRVGRMQEEMIFDINGALLRRRIQEFDNEGKPRMRVMDIVKHIPEDLQLVITEPKPIDPELAKKMRKEFHEQATEVQKDAKDDAGGDAKPSGGRKKGFFRNIFGKG